MVEDEAPFLAGNGKQTLDLSPIKIVKVRHELFPNDRVSKVNIILFIVRVLSWHIGQRAQL